MVFPSDLLTLFAKDLANLKDNDKYKINALTIIARDHKDMNGVAQGIVEETIKHVLTIPAELKLIGLYVIDSIVKNVGAPYRKLYTMHIVDAFVHSFQEIRDEKGRLKLYNLRTTWKDIFPNLKMYELDIRVREHDPAWPLLTAPPETKSTFRSLPNIPKLNTKSDLDKASPEIQNVDLQTEVVISESRDPRLNRKRKSSPQPPATQSENFMIDRSGDKKMEAVARKHGREAETSDSTKKPCLFGGEDLDMRAQLHIADSAARSAKWSSYIGRHNEIRSRRDAKDVDMRFVRDSVVAKPPDSNFIEPSKSKAPDVPISKPPDLPFKESRNSNSNPVYPAIYPDNRSLPSSHLRQSSDNDVPPRLPHSTNHVYEKRFPSKHNRNRHLPAPFTKHEPPRGPPIRGPVWTVEIDGLPDMVNIGIDPRMLNLVNQPKPPRRITIDGHQYTLLLDRVQPLVSIDDRIHAVRFRCEHATVVIDDICFTIPGTGFTKVRIGSRMYTAYLGGPGHELIIDGRPHTVPLTSHVTFINVGSSFVGVKFTNEIPRHINVLPPIPLRLLKWAGQGLFGSPRNLHLAPLNPLKELSLLAEHGHHHSEPRRMMNHHEMRPVFMDPSHKRDHFVHINHAPKQSGFLQPVSQAETHSPSSVPNTSVVAPTQPSVDVHELFQKLVKAGIVPLAEPTTSTEPPDLANYTWEKFKNPCLSEIDNLLSGHQCSQCGLRFESELSPDFAKHLDYHYLKNSNDLRDQRSRNYYQPLQYWLISEMTCEGASKLESGSPIRNLQEYRCPSFADPSKNVCAVCYESFEVVWDHEEEEWMLQDAIRVDDKVYHPICQEDAGKEFTAKEIKREDSVDGESKSRKSSVSLSDIKPEIPEESNFTCGADDDDDDNDTATAVTDKDVNNDDEDNNNDNNDNDNNNNNSNNNNINNDDYHSDEPDEYDATMNTKIPGLSPEASETVEDTNDVIEPEPEATDRKTVQNPNLLSITNISSDPLTALKAVLKGNVSALNFQSTSTI